MKKTMILAAIAALVSLASCQKEEVIDNNGSDKSASPVFTASIAGATKTTIVLPEGSYTKIEITNASDVKCVLNSTSGVAVAANHIKPVTFGGSKLNFLPVGALPSVFSVSDTKKVHFSKGNLAATIDAAGAPTAWKFAANQ